MQPMKATSPPTLPAATAWFAPLPPGVITTSEPMMVSPAAGRWSTSRTRSALADPTTTTLCGLMLLLTGRATAARTTHHGEPRPILVDCRAGGVTPPARHVPGDSRYRVSLVTTTTVNVPVVVVTKETL